MLTNDLGLPTMRGFKIANAELSRDIRAHVAQCQALRARLAGLPERVAVKSLLDAAEIVKLAPDQACGVHEVS